MRNKIMVVGGYGNVGQIISKELGQKFPGKVIAAGRSYAKAKDFALKTEGKVMPAELDVSLNQKNNGILDEVCIVVMCLDQKDTGFVEVCINKGIHYVDITASYNFLSKIEKLKLAAQKSGSAVVLSTGIAPGLTNLLVQFSKDHFDRLDRAEIFLMLGLGDSHGKAAVEWTVEQINTMFSVVEDGKFRKVRSFEDGKKTEFPENIGMRTAYRYNFTDQHVLPNTLNIPSVSTRMCFDSALFTNLFALLKKIGLFNILKIQSIRNIFVSIFEEVNLGSDIFVAKVDSYGIKDGNEDKFECSIVGNKEGYITGKVAKLIAEYIYTRDYPAGVYHIEELFKSAEIFRELSEDIRFYINSELVSAS